MSTDARMSGPLRWLAWLPLALAALVMLAALAAWVAGLRLQGVSWQQGLHVAGWQLRQQDCVALQGSQLRLEAWRPVSLRMQRLTLRSCDQEPPSLQPPPWTPPFDLHVDRFEQDGLPPLTLDVRQREQRWHIIARHADSQVEVRYDRQNGRWQAGGLVRGADLLPELLGELKLAGQGHWLSADRLEGSARIHGLALGWQGRAQRADARVDARLAGGDWQLNADLDAPVALAAGWQLSAHRALRAHGSFDGLAGLDVDLRAEGPQGQVKLQLATAAPGVARGEGGLTLSGHELEGHLPLAWSGRELTLSPARLRLPGQLRLELPEALVIPLASTGTVRLPLRLRYEELALATQGSDLTWRDGLWSWQGALALSGQAAGQHLAGSWRGRLDAAGPSGEPVRLQVSSRELKLSAALPVAGVRAPAWPLAATFSGRYGDYPLSGTLSARRTGESWQGQARVDSRMPFYDQGGELSLAMPWLLRSGLWQAQPGTRLDISEGLKRGLLIKPVALTATTPVRPAPGGLQGELALTAGGLVAARAGIPALTGPISLNGRQGQARLQVADWQSQLQLTAALPAGQAASGRLTLDTPLVEAMSKGLGFTLKQGRLNATADWRWRDSLTASGEAQVSGLGMDWGGIVATGGQGRLRFRHGPEGTLLDSLGALTLDQLDIGTPVTGISLVLGSDLKDWRFSDMSASVLGGRVSASALHWPAAEHQVVTLSGIDLARVAALQNQESPPVQLAGTVGGSLPLLLGRDSVSLREGELRNEVPLSLQVMPTAGVAAMSQSNRAVQLAMDTLSNLLVSDFRAAMSMAPDGWLDAAVTIKGVSAQPNRQPVVLNYTHRENVLELLRSLRIGDEISQQVMDRHKKAMKQGEGTP